MNQIRNEWLTKLIREVQMIAGRSILHRSNPAAIKARLFHVLNRRIANPIPDLVGFKGKASLYRAFNEFTGRPPGYWRRRGA